VVPPTTNVASAPSLPPVTATPTSSMPNKINDVQTAALDGILELKGIPFEELAKEAFEYNNEEAVNLPTKEELSYQQAVMIIKYGNEKFRK